MKKEFVPYTESLELKQLGFDEPCLAVFNDSKQFRINSESRNWNDNLVNGDTTSSPTYSQAFRWFREKYGLRIRNYVFVNMSNSIGEGFEVFRYAKDTISSVWALTYEEAELECLKKLIEIVKTK